MLNVNNVAQRVRTFRCGGGVVRRTQNWGGRVRRTQIWGGVVCRTQKWGGTHLRPKAAQIWAPPLGMFLAASLNLKIHFMAFGSQITDKKNNS